jgi:hypothetical protein
MLQEHMNEGKCGEDPCLPRFLRGETRGSEQHVKFDRTSRHSVRQDCDEISGDLKSCRHHQ